jgi:hypothetical protein
MPNNARVGGILTIIAGAFGVLGLFWMLFAILIIRFAFSEALGSAPPAEFLTMMTILYSIWGICLALVGALGVVGGVFALKKRRWGLALAGAIAGGVTFFPCGIPAIIFVTLAKPEFSDKKPTRPRRK